MKIVIAAICKGSGEERCLWHMMREPVSETLTDPDTKRVMAEAAAHAGPGHEVLIEHRVSRTWTVLTSAEEEE